MKRLVLFFSIAFFAVCLIGCGGTGEKKSKDPQFVEFSNHSVAVYYFHGKQRCRGCIAIQDVAKETVDEHFASNNEVAFIEIDFSEKENEGIAEKYEVANSSLIVAIEGEHINLTDIAFANALRTPEVLKETIVNEVNKYINR